jgi:hypothetical protein
VRGGLFDSIAEARKLIAEYVANLKDVFEISEGYLRQLQIK